MIAKKELRNVEEREADLSGGSNVDFDRSCEKYAASKGKNATRVTKTFLLSGLNCPNCSAKIEKEVGELDCVKRSEVNIIKQTLTIDIDSDAASGIEKEVKTIVRRHEPDIAVSDVTDIASGAQTEKENRVDKVAVIRLILGAAIYVIGLVLIYTVTVPLAVSLALLIASYIILGVDVVFKACKNILKGRIFDENFLMTVSTIGAFVIGEYPEAVAVMLFYQVGELFQDLAVRRSRKNIVALMDIRPDTARVMRNGETLIVPPETVSVGETIVCRPGEKIPLDGVVVDGESMLDTKALTGESLPKRAYKGVNVLSGCINQSGAITIKVTKAYGESTVAKIIDLVENASAKKAKAENFITTFAKYYTPTVVLLAAVLAILPPLAFGGTWTEWLHRGFVFLVISCPCALVISVPLAFFAGIGAASRHGVLVKGGNYLEALDKLGIVVFDKTGTLTEGIFEVTELLPAEGFLSEQLLEYGAVAESLSNHPIAASIQKAYNRKTAVATDYKEVAGLGVRAIWKEKQILAGNAKLMINNDIAFAPVEKAGTKVYVAVDGRYAGCILISDVVKADSRAAIEKLKGLGVDKTVMMTGDENEIAAAVASEIGIDEYHSELLPSDKVAGVEALLGEKKPWKKLAFVGDGINDAPVLARADLGIAMGGSGADAAIEAADVVLMTDEPSGIAEAVRIAKATKRIVAENIVFALTVKVVFLILGALGIAGMWEAVFGDVGVALLAVLNAMRMIRK